MRFIRVWAYNCARYLSDNMKESHQKRSIYYYGFQILISSIVKTSLLVIISLFIGTLLPTLVVLAAFASLRVLAGGYHMDSYGKCAFFSIGMFVLGGVIAKYTVQYWDLIILCSFSAAALAAGIFVLIRWAPRDNPRRPITKAEEIRNFRKLSFIYMCLWIIVNVTLILMKHNIYVISICFGMLFELLTIVPFGYNFFEWLSGNVDKLNKQQKFIHNRR
ncbi:MAG: accessory gene regulator B family protein [Bacillota bacterium]|nr:accessory gene regulator B family protein [Bacillota bacterium]